MLTQNQKLLLDLSLGDGYIQFRERLKDGKYPYTSLSLNIAHQPAQFYFLEWKRDLLNKTFQRAINRPL